MYYTKLIWAVPARRRSGAEKKGGPAVEQAEQLRLEGVIESIIFHSEETGFTVMEVAVDDELVTVVGESMELSPGEEIAATGTLHRPIRATGASSRRAASSG